MEFGERNAAEGVPYSVSSRNRQPPCRLLQASRPGAAGGNHRVVTVQAGGDFVVVVGKDVVRAVARPRRATELNVHVLKQYILP